MAGPSPSFETRERSQIPNSLILRHSEPDAGSESIRSLCPQQAEARLRGAQLGVSDKAATRRACRY